MNAKLVTVTCVMLITGTWWLGCSSSDSASPPSTSDAGGVIVTPEASTSAPDSSGSADSGGKDAAKDATPIDGGGLTGPFVDIPYGAASCPDFSACGGDLTGTWNIKGGCVTEAILADAKKQCAGLVESDVHFKARGYVTGTATTITRNTELEYTAKLAIPVECKPTMAPFNTCAAVGTGLVALAMLEAATCTDDAATGGCNCDVADSFIDQGTDTYTATDGTLTTGAGRTFDYCVDAGMTQLTYLETTAKAVPATFVLQK